jgi:integration host factor subunit alpha
VNRGEGQGPWLKRREEAARLVSYLLDEIAGALERGMPVELRGLGALNVKAKRERQGRNPRTGEAVTIDARRVVRFRASELLLAQSAFESPAGTRQDGPAAAGFPD